MSPQPHRSETNAVEMDQEFQTLFHSLNNQLGIILAHAELLESKAATDTERARAAQVVASVLDAMRTARSIRRHAELTDIPTARLNPVRAVSSARGPQSPL